MAIPAMVLATGLLACGGGGGGGGGGAEPGATQGVASQPPAAGVAVPQAAGSSPIVFTLDAEAGTSAGVYTPDGTLVRTLWRGERRAAGRHAVAWDLNDDAGRPVGAGRYEVRVLVHDVRYVWEGVVGNTSAHAPWTEVFRSYEVPKSMLAGSAGMILAAGYNEGQDLFLGFEWAAPQRNRSPLRRVDPFASAVLVAGDGQRVYWASGGGFEKTSFIGAFDAASGAQAPFTQGAPLCLARNPANGQCWAPQDYRGVIGVRPADERPSGLAVQAGGPVLAVAWPTDGRVALFDKTSGRTLGGFPAALRSGAANQIAMTAAGDLWVLDATGATRWTELAGTPRAAARIDGLVRPLAVATDPRDDDRVWIADGGSSQQLKRFDRAGVARQVVGQPGGQLERSAVVDDRFCFFTSHKREETALAVAPDGQLWALDTCNLRLVRVAADGTPVPLIAWRPTSYLAAVDPGAPQRVFSNFIEYAVDPALAPDQPGAWRVLRNWLTALPPELRQPEAQNAYWGGWRVVRTLANGRTYAVAPGGGRLQLVELQADGRVRLIGALPAAAAGGTEPQLYENGELGDAVTEGGVLRVRRRALAGFDAAGNPRWDAPRTLATAAVVAGTPVPAPGTFAGIHPQAFPVTASGRVLLFDPGVDGNEGFHLGAMAVGGSRWQWMASPTGALDGRGAFQTKAVDGSIHYGGNQVMVNGRSVLYGYHGEFYRDLSNGAVGQANQFMHFDEDGLFIGQFGISSTRGAAIEPGRAGNAFSPALVTHAGRTYLYHNDESVFGGVQRWRIDGLDTVRVMRGSGIAGAAISVQ